MSDSDNENASDSEYDSDDWGDESNAWHKSKLLSLKQQKEYFFKSQESLATVIDNDEDEEIESSENEASIIPLETAEGDKKDLSSSPALSSPGLGSGALPGAKKDVADDDIKKETTTTEKQLDTELTTASKKTTNV